MLPKLALLVSVIVFVVAIFLSFVKANFITGPNGWLDLALVLAIYSIAVKYIHESKEYERGYAV